MSEPKCPFCNNTGFHLCPDVAEPVLVRCSRKGCPIVDRQRNLESRLAEAEKALEWYADSKSWKFVDYQSEVRETILSTDLTLEGMQFPFGGKRAREYFKKWNNKRTSAESEK